MTLLVWFTGLTLKSLLQRGNQTMKMTSRQQFDIIKLSHFEAKTRKFHVEIW